MGRRLNGEGTIYKDDTRGRWVAELSVFGQRRRRVAKTKAEAARALKEMQQAGDQGVALDGSMTVAQVLASWRSSLDGKDLAPSTIVAYAWCCDVLVGLIGKDKAARLTPERIERAFAKLAAGGAARSSLVKLRSALDQAFARAERRGHVARNPARVVELPASAKRVDRGDAMTAEQVDALLAVTVGHPLHAAWVLGARLGLRPGEVLGLHWSDIERGVLHVRHAIKVVDNAVIVSDILKTAGSRRSLRMPAAVADALAEHEAVQGAQRRHAGDVWSETGLVFTTGVGTPWSPSNARRAFAQACTTAGIGAWSPNDLRHHRATEMGERGVPLEQIADVLGHTTTRMAYQVYRRRPAVVDVS